MVPVNRVIAIYARENGQGMAFPVPVQGGAEQPSAKPSPLTSVPAAGGQDEDNKIVQLVNPENGEGGGPDGEPPRPPSGPRPALKRVK
jgi:stringent starvation protein B